MLAQCPLALTCEGTPTFCDLNDLDNFRCINGVSPGQTFPFQTLCRGAGVPRNVTWFSFIGNGDDLSLGFNVDPLDCQIGAGIQAGVFEGSCDGRSIWDCTNMCQTATFSLAGPTKKLTTYYVWINGCNFDQCEFEVLVNGSLMNPTLPIPLDTPQLSGNFCPGGRIEVCHTEFAPFCFPDVRWFIDDSLIVDSTELCFIYNIPEDAVPGTRQEFKIIVGKGNPDGPNGYCESDSTSILGPAILPIERRQGNCTLVCYEDQPFSCPKGVRTANGCSLRTRPVGEDCLVDSIFKVVVLPEPNIGIRDTFVCDLGYRYTDENGVVYNNEVCDQLISFEKEFTSSECPGLSVTCDTSYYLSIGRFVYTSNWEIDCPTCSASISICPNIRYNPTCPKYLGQVQVELDWYNNMTGQRLGKTSGTGCITVRQVGTYCAEVSGFYKGRKCTNEVPECIIIDSSFFKYDENLTGDNRVCHDSVGVYEIRRLPKACEFVWSVAGGNGAIITPNALDSNRVRVKFNDLTRDTAQVCVVIKSDCAFSTHCMKVAICPRTTSNDNLNPGTLYHSMNTQELIWDRLDDGQYQLDIFSIDGNLLIKKRVASQGKFNIDHLQRGCYFGKISSLENGQIKLIKFIR